MVCPNSVPTQLLLGLSVLVICYAQDYIKYNQPRPGNFPQDPTYDQNSPDFNRDINNPNYNIDPSNPNYNRDPNNPNYNRDLNNPNYNTDFNSPNYNRDPNNPNYNRDLNNPNYNKDFNNQNYNRDSSNPNYDPNLPTNDPLNPRIDQNFPTNPNFPVIQNNPGQYDPNYPNPTGQYDPKYPNRNPGSTFGHNDFDEPNRSPWQDNALDSGYRDQGRGPSLEHESLIINEATYFIVASRMVRPGQVYKVAVNILRARLRMTVRASMSCNGVEMSHAVEKVKEGVPETLNMRVPSTSVPGEYKLRVEGLYLDDPFGGKAFINETLLTFSSRFMTIFIQMDKPVYMQSQTVNFRVIPINTELKAFSQAIDVYILDPNRHIMKRWLSRQSNFGTVSLSYKLSDQPVFGEWIVQVNALGQIEESTFLVEEYYQTRFEVNVTMPAFFFNTDPFIYGRIMANYTSGAPVLGNLTLRATVRPIPQYRPQYYRQGQFNNRGQFGTEPNYDNSQYTRVQPNYNPYNPAESTPYQPFGVNAGVDAAGRPIPVTQSPRFRPGQPNQLEHPGWFYDHTKVVERHFNFDEAYPFWMVKPDPYNTGGYNNYLPYLRFFNGTYEFRYPMRELEQLVPTLDGTEVIITATVGERFLDEVIEGYSIARIHNSSLKVSFLGGSPQVFKPSMPYDYYLAVSFHDGSPLRDWLLAGVNLEVQVAVEGGSSRRDVPLQKPIPEPGKPGIFHLKLDLKAMMGLEEARNSKEALNDVQSVRLTAFLQDAHGGRATAELLLLAHHSPKNHHLKISTSTQDAKVGQYIIFHVQSNFYMESFNYLVMSKGMMLTTGQEIMQETVRTFAVTLSAEMAPVATVVVWSAGRRGDVLADSLTFPVNGISRNNFTVFVNNRKARTGERVEIAIYGEPGAYVGLSAIDNAFYTMQAGNELTYAKVITKMARFDEQTNGTFSYIWHSHLGMPDELVYFPSSSFGIDANRTFDYSGLVVFSDVAVSRRSEFCNHTMGLGECLNGRCYRLDKQCDGVHDCEDGTDEVNCETERETELAHFRKFRFNRIQRQYDNVWMWRDVNIGPHGRFVFTVDVPRRPAHWTLSVFSMSPSMGFGMLRKPLEYVGTLPFFVVVEAPSACRQGEQVGVRAAVFNYMGEALEATVVLAGSPDYKFVHVEEHGIVRSYNPRTSFGEHQFFVYIPAGSATTVHLPVVPTRLGDIHVTVYASTLLGKHQDTKIIHVTADGVPQYRHQSILLDLSNRAYVFQYLHVNVTETPIIPYDVDRYYVFGSNHARVSVVGDVVGPIFPTMPVNATSLLYLPMDSAEQNMFSFAANLYTTLYMRLINQRNRTIEKESFYHLNILYQRQLSFMKPDGSFGLFRSDWNQSESSVWLTSFCARIFQDASFYEWENYIYIDPEVISKAISWVLEHQTPEGAFYEVTWLPDRKDNSTLQWPNDPIGQRNITLTAQVVITLHTVKDLKDLGTRGGLGARVALAQQRGLAWLERNLRLLAEHGQAYDVALVAYALMVSGASNSEAAFRILARHARSEGGLTYWGKEAVPPPPYKLENQKPFLLPRLPYKYDSTNIESTAYALLTYTARQELMLEPIVIWLNAQRLTDGGWASSQDTYVSLKALIEYTTRKRLRDVSALSVTVEATALPGNARTLYVNQKNIAVLQSLDIPHAWGTVKVQARGAGYAILQMSVQYNVDIAKYQTPPPVPSFDLRTQANFYGRNQSHITYQSCQSWTYLEESPRSGMAVLEVGIPTGYWVQQQRLDAYVLSRHVRNLQRARYTHNKLLFYFHYLDHDPTCVNFTIERWYPVANMSRYLAIRVYDYYAPERFNETIFDALPTYLLNICEVCGSSQCPYCSVYNAAHTLATQPHVAALCAITAMLLAYRHVWPLHNIL